MTFRRVIWFGFAAIGVGAGFGGCGGSSGPSNFDDVVEDASKTDTASNEDDAGTGFQLDSSFGNFDDSAVDAKANDGGLFNDATPDALAGDACVTGDAGPAPLKQRCAPATANECVGTDLQLTALGVPASMLNGSNGNGFDDDCDGLVDEGCPCTGGGTTKDCYLIPPTQADPNTKKPVGWCTDNSKGSLDCAGAEFPKWSGTCRGAQPPYLHDVCALGDFNCDGQQQNSDVQDCACHEAPVTCPTAPLTEAPYPDPKNITPVDGSTWIGNGQVAQTTNWKWTVVGGDCDNILPHPTYAIYNQKNTSVAGSRIGARTAVKFNAALNPPEFVATPNVPLLSLLAATGNGAAGATVYPAFGLSGDYIVQGEFDLGGQHYVCTQKVQVRAPGIRAELCWDTVGDTGTASNGGSNDIDLHLARLQGVTCANKGWDDTCAQAGTYEDCWWDNASGCRDFSSVAPGWGYPDSPDSACIGWSSKRHVKGTTSGVYSFPQGCTNPRLDRDNITCAPSIEDPNAPVADATGNGGFCGPENINLDNPKNGDQFVVGVTHFANKKGTADAKVHVNLYCGGARVVSVGYNPAATPPSGFPVLKTAGSDETGDYWSVATVKWNAANPQGCDVATVPSITPDPARDGPSNKTVCVDSKGAGAPAPYTSHKFVEANGSIPATAAGFCKH
jgi:hypothetical protein